MAMQRLWICEPLAWSGLSAAQMCTARLYAEGSQGAIRNTGVAASWYGQAALNGSEAAVRRLMGVTRNKVTQRRLLEKAALAGNGAAMYQLYLLLGPQEGLRWLNMAIELRQADALYQQSRYLQTGEQGFGQDVELANALLKEAAWGGSPMAAADLSLAYESGDRPFGYSHFRSLFWEWRVDDQWPGYLRWLSRLEHWRQLRGRIGRGDAQAMLELARYVRSKAQMDSAFEADAREWFEQAAESGSTDAQYEIAFTYFRHPDAALEEMADARRWLTAAADGQHRYALSNIAYYLTNGQYGFQIDLELARDYARTLVALLSSEVRPHQRDLDLAKTRLGLIEAQLAKQVAWEDGLDELQAGAAAGDAEARYRLYEKHVGDRERGDWALAESLLLAAAEQGHIESRYRIASRTLSQPRTPAEEARAYLWMQDAAARGHRGALVAMGRVHLRGLPKYGIEKNPDTARALLERALEGLAGDVVYARRNGSETVATRRESVERLLSGIEATSAPR
jgi:TPR repeat protein